MPRYLSLEWIDALRAEVDANDTVRDAADAAAQAGHRFAITQVVTDGPEGDVTYHLAVEDGIVQFGAGPADDEQVRMVQDWDTAVAVATGSMNAQEAFITGRIRLTGDQQALLDAQPVFAALDGVFGAVRERTEYE